MANSSKDDTVNHPSHYKKGGLECIDIIDAMVSGLDARSAVYVSQVVKYVYRHDDKGGSESLYKARCYLDRLIAHRETMEE
jgi:hypothetical protein